MSDKKLQYYMSLPYSVVLKKEEDQGETYYAAEIPELPGCGTSGRTPEEAIKKIEEDKKAWIEVSLEKKMPIPEPVSEDLYSGKFLLRIPVKLHMKLSKEAEKEGISLNQYIRSQLENKLDIQMVLKNQVEFSKKMDSILGIVTRLQNEMSCVNSAVGELWMAQQQILTSEQDNLLKKRKSSDLLFFGFNENTSTAKA